MASEELIAHGRESMAAYSYPRIVEIIDELPKTTAGKILRRQLRDWPSPDRCAPPTMTAKEFEYTSKGIVRATGQAILSHLSI